jgi:tetratricopeptide (TPR) repeat protein
VTRMDFEQKVEALWASIDDYGDEEFRAKMDEVVAELPADSPVAAYERGSAFDSTGHSDKAVPLYREALERGLDGPRRRQCVIQMASSLRNMGEVEESVAALTAERDRASDELDDAISAFLALALVDAGRDREAVSVALTALAPHLPRYQRSVTSYARDLTEPA